MNHSAAKGEVIEQMLPPVPPRLAQVPPGELVGP
jgi:hypothetical protein